MRMTGAAELDRQALASEGVLSSRIRVERERRGWTQEEFADRVVAELGSPFVQSAVSKIEGSRRSVSLDEALAFSRVFEIPLSELSIPEGAAQNDKLARLMQRVRFIDAQFKRAEAVRDSELQQIRRELEGDERLLIAARKMQDSRSRAESADARTFLAVLGMRGV